MQESLQDRRLRLLRLEDQRVALVAADQEVDPGMRADAPDPDHLAGGVDEPVLLERMVLARERVAGTC